MTDVLTRVPSVINTIIDPRGNPDLSRTFSSAGVRSSRAASRDARTSQRGGGPTPSSRRMFRSTDRESSLVWRLCPCQFTQSIITSHFANDFSTQVEICVGCCVESNRLAQAPHENLRHLGEYEDMFDVYLHIYIAPNKPISTACGIHNATIEILAFNVNTLLMTFLYLCYFFLIVVMEI